MACEGDCMGYGVIVWGGSLRVVGSGVCPGYIAEIILGCIIEVARLNDRWLYHD